ncbi:MAG: hypothetical protein HC796_05425, partial [Synechococcaceae cyanobacterium RL_1_2]|nr:hypothetical protein [Synechococcaceae cyanobacterium RL_1_2]
MAITVNPINDGPVNTVPSTYSTNEDTPLVLTGISVVDVDANPNSLLINLAVTNGQLALASSTGLSFVDDNGTDGTLAFT